MKQVRGPRAVTVLGSLALLSCAQGAPLLASAEASAAPIAAPSTCATQKLSFQRNNGCVNDGSVELCIPSGDPEAEQAVHAIAKDVRCSQGSRGRIGCSEEREMLCLAPLGPADCPQHHGALADAGWAKVCALAALPFVRRIEPTWYE